MIYTIMLAACTAFYLVDVVQWHKILQYNKKPINCVACLSAWFGLLFGLMDGYGAYSLGMMAYSGVAGVVLIGLISKIHK